MQIAENNIIISINTKMSIKMFATNNRIIIKESFAGNIMFDILAQPPFQKYTTN